MMEDIFDVFEVHEPTSYTATVLWKSRYMSHGTYGVCHVKCDVAEIRQDLNSDDPSYAGFFCFEDSGSTDGVHEIELPYTFEPGKKYTISLLMRNPVRADNENCWHGNAPAVISKSTETTFIKRYSIATLEQMMHKSLEFSPISTGKGLAVELLYRNKPKLYWDYIFEHRRGKMEIYQKDGHGHAGCPINGKISGIFFSARAQPTPVSPFGDTRLYVPIDALFNSLVNLYFADFYCNNNVHYVTLVIAKEHTFENDFCKRSLVALDKRDNPYLQFSEQGDNWSGVFVATGASLHVELFFTENLDLHELLGKGAHFETVPSTGSSTPGGQLRNRLCSICDVDY